ncbi:hypothetical protein P8C59_004898 [Phyllachora maydis]|uniref:Inositol oxygenase n=1 Tax=Phyllachora maydis TaxID=1825666 RepID=A0AAD9I4J2_9PEZI|nr:hypothetical protein P8C59_004898 [Phyllachora maydis]
MAPSAILDSPSPGAILEALSDAIDDVNVLKAKAAQKLADLAAPPYDAASQFDAAKDKTQFRQYETACDRVRNFYAEQHAKQTVAYNLAARARFHSRARPRPALGVWEAMERLDTLVDESDPDTALSQMQHLLQSAEALRRDGRPRWMQLTGLIHDLGKLMLFFDPGAQGQWDVVGDTFVVGCAFDRRCIYPDTFAANPDAGHPVYATRLGVYEAGCGMENVMLSWGHDEYLYEVVRDQSTLPPEALAIIRYHSFYPWHREGAYREFMADGDEDLLRAVQAFNPYDLYSKSDDVPSVEELKPYYLELIDEFFPQKKILW